jgi:hypothetical protein
LKKESTNFKESRVQKQTDWFDLGFYFVVVLLSLFSRSEYLQISVKKLTFKILESLISDLFVVVDRK